MHKRCGIRGKLKEESKFECQACMCKSANRHSRRSAGIELNGQFLEIVKKF